MKCILTFLVAILLVAPSFGAMTYDQAYYRANVGYLGSAGYNDPLYNFIGEVATTLAEGTTFTGGAIAGDITVATGKYIKSGTTSKNITALQVYDLTAAASYTNVLSWESHADPNIVLGAATNKLSIVGATTLAFNNGATVSQPANNLLEFTENSETLGLIFGTNKIELGAGGTGVVTLDFNDVDKLEDIESLTGDGDGAITGFKKVVEAHTAADELTATESGSVHTNAGASGNIALTLPTAVAGQEFTFIVMAAHQVQVTPAAGDAIYVNAVAGDAVEHWWADAVGESVHLIAVDATNWIAVSHIGTWTQATP
jgi:hypothetical protein